MMYDIRMAKYDYSEEAEFQHSLPELFFFQHVNFDALKHQTSRPVELNLLT